MHKSCVRTGPKSHSSCTPADLVLLLMQHGLGDFAAEMAMTAAEFGESLTIGSYKVRPSGFSQGQHRTSRADRLWRVQAGPQPLPRP